MEYTNPQQANTQSTMMFNQGVNNPGALQIRLSTQSIIDQIEAFLRGKRYVLVANPRTGTLEQKEIGSGKPILNERGVNEFIPILQAGFNAITAQGNIDSQRYEELVYEFDVNISTNLMVNRQNWELELDKYNLVMDSIMIFAQLFFSRQIDNEERIALSQSARTTESTIVQNKGGGFLGFGGR